MPLSLVTYNLENDDVKINPLIAVTLVPKSNVVAVDDNVETFHASLKVNLCISLLPLPA